MKYNLRLAAFLFCVSSISLAQDVTRNETPRPFKVVIVDVTQQWVATGIIVNSGDTVLVFVDGIASTTGGGGYPIDRQYWLGPEGFGGAKSINNPDTSSSSFSVIGRVGPSGTPFFVGRMIGFKANVSGELYLGFNDNVFFDNIGYYLAYVYNYSNPQ